MIPLNISDSFKDDSFKETKNKTVKEFDTVQVFHHDVLLSQIFGLISDDGKKLYGDCSHLKGLIRMDAGLPTSIYIQSLIHEMMHFAMDNFYAKLDTEENMQSFALIFCNMLKNNKELFKAILEEI